MSLHQHPDSIIKTDNLTSEQRSHPQTRAAINLHEIAVALSGAGFEVHADTWRLYFHEPEQKGFLGWFQGRRPQFEIRAHDAGFTIYTTALHMKDRETVEGDKATILRFVTEKFPKRICYHDRT